ncbi:MAG: helix-hairpin-helix domain-containing protein, partial [Eubacteriales bacterium]|nr:helix-hairpin-helix domain-containing protein [Eubacteriales bacterium]
SFNSFANENTEITSSSTSATVLQIIDTDAIKVSLDGSNQVAFVKLRGIKGNAFNPGFEYLTNTLLGEKVMLIKDGYIPFNGKWNYMNVFYNGININNELVANGYAMVDKTQNQGSYYQTLINSQNIANSYGLGIWQEQSPNYSSITGNTTNSYYTKDKVNINTASLSQLKTLLKGVSNQVAENIIYYRERNPFTTIQEIKFVKGFTKEMYTQNKNVMSVSTNINTANEYELVTLGLSGSEINALIELRNKKEFSQTSDILSVISNTKYNKLKPFISMSNQTEISYTISSSIANINVSNKSYIEKAGVSSIYANEIVANRKNGYTYKTLMEIGKFKSNAMKEIDLHKYEDNLSLVTNLNSSNEEELVYLFNSTTLGKNIYKQSFKNKEELRKFISESEYQKLKDAVYVNKIENDYININTATKAQMENVGFSSSDASRLINARPMVTSNDIPFNISSLNSKVSLYTNINKASRNELYSLGLD